MNHTIESALGHATIGNRRRFLSEYQFNLGELRPRVTIRLYENLEARNVEFEQSHYIKTPLQAEPYMTSKYWGDDEGDALGKAINTLTMEYEGAIRSGKEPNDSWLVPNKYWNS